MLHVVERVSEGDAVEELDPEAVTDSVTAIDGDLEPVHVREPLELVHEIVTDGDDENDVEEEFDRVSPPDRVGGIVSVAVRGSLVTVNDLEAVAVADADGELVGDFSAEKEPDSVQIADAVRLLE